MINSSRRVNNKARLYFCQIVFKIKIVYNDK